jgi:hypothetical protein
MILINVIYFPVIETFRPAAVEFATGPVPGKIMGLPADQLETHSMSEKTFARRTLLKGALLGVAAVPVTALLGRAEAAGAKVDPSEPQAKSLGYVEDATKVDAKANPNYKAGQICANCLQATGKPGDAMLPCNIFAQRPVNAKGWCKVYVKRP